MALNLALVGKKSLALSHSYTWRDAVLYALGVGARMPTELDYLYEASGPKVIPTFAVVPSFTTLVNVCSQLGANLMMIVHGEQKVIQHRPIPPNGTFQTVAEVTGIYDKGKGALVVVEARTTDEKGEPVFDNVFSIFVRGAGGFGGERGPEALVADVPTDRAPDFSVTERTSAEQAALYRLSGDLNPLHVSASFAKMAGFERPILHGLCTYGYACRAVLHSVCGSDPARFRSFAARFSGTVFPGDELTTQGWQTAPGSYVVRVVTQEGKVVLSNSIAEVAS